MHKAIAQPQPPQPESRRATVWGKLKTLTVVLVLLGLASLNVLTLVNDTIHAAAYGFMRAILAGVVADATVSRLLSKSPTIRRQTDVAALSASTKALEKKHADLARASQDKAATARKVSKRLVSRAAANATRNASSVFGESIPYVGIAIILGVTALDIRDACETVKDANELNQVFGDEQEDHTRICGMEVPTKDKVLAEVKANWKAAYQSAAKVLSDAGYRVISMTPPKVTWSDVREAVCAVLGRIPGICPKDQ